MHNPNLALLLFKSEPILRLRQASLVCLNYSKSEGKDNGNTDCGMIVQS